MPKLELDETDIDTISKYVRIAQPEYSGAVFIDIKRLAERYMYIAGFYADNAIRSAMK